MQIYNIYYTTLCITTCSLIDQHPRLSSTPPARTIILIPMKIKNKISMRWFKKMIEVPSTKVMDGTLMKNFLSVLIYLPIQMF